MRQSVKVVRCWIWHAQKITKIIILTILRHVSQISKPQFLAKTPVVQIIINVWTMVNTLMFQQVHRLPGWLIFTNWEQCWHLQMAAQTTNKDWHKIPTTATLSTHLKNALKNLQNPHWTNAMTMQKPFGQIIWTRLCWIFTMPNNPKSPK